ncbi:MAG: tRNA pseudouridine(38-40) synthase TruA [Fusicatenibacter sp.]|nr:tRNA pseudouridine(38-40) synthase TruA [Lachnospiraceae bacterium]MDY2938470.1 tRNA pseudouridine(38-40) synthase TruA [Fusicatenibacter sp.]
MNYKMIIQYDGTRYNGWQKQGNTENTIQGKMETLLGRIAGEEVEVHGAGRTDAGVHAKGQTANARFHTDLSDVELLSAINRYLPEDIWVADLCRVPERFHSRLNAVEKTYEYRIAVDGGKHIFERKYLYFPEELLDVEAMKKAANHFVGKYDFKSFCANKKMKKSTVRCISRIAFCEKDGILSISFTGDGFLYHMVRILCGTLIEVGMHKREADSMNEILQAKDREKAGFCAPACGLTLISVNYDKNETKIEA